MSGVRAGDVIAGKFQVERVLGEGGMGYVVAARHLQLGQMVALKFMRDDVMTDDYRSRFLREARNTVRLKSKHVSRVLDVGSLEGSGAPYMVMEYLEGTDLSDLLQKRGPFPPSEACDYIIQACEAIAEAHGHGIVHRDLKPANLFLTRGHGGEPVIKVLDFGVSKVLELGMDEDDTSAGGRHHADSVVTKATDLLGSPSYMAPEQVISARDADSRSDVWSLGVILFRLVSGKAPFTGASLGDLIQNIMHGPMPNLRDLRPDLPEGLEHVVLRCMERERSRRMNDVIELARMLAIYAGPNAAPSLERIAILGPALVTAVPQAAPSAPSFITGGKSTWTSPPGAIGSSRTGAQTGNVKKDMSMASFIGWAVLFAAVVASLAVVGAKIITLRAAPVPRDTTYATPPPPTIAATSATPPEAPPPPTTTTAAIATAGAPITTATTSSTVKGLASARPHPTGHARPPRQPPTTTQKPGPAPPSPPSPPPPVPDIPPTRE